MFDNMDLFALQPILGTPLESLDDTFHATSSGFADPGSSTPIASATPPPLGKHELVRTEKIYPDAIFRTYHSLGLDVVLSPAPATISTTVQDRAGSARVSIPGNSGKAVGGEGLGWIADRVDIYNPPPKLAAGSSPAASAAPQGVRRRAVKAGPRRDAPPTPISLRLARRPDLPPAPDPPIQIPEASIRTVPTTIQATNSGPGPGSGSNGARTDGTASEAAQAQEPSGVMDPDSLLLRITPHTTGADLVQHLGEPSRKGGGDRWVAPWLEWSDVEIVPAAQESLDSTTSCSPTTSSDDVGGGTVRIGVMVELRQPAVAAEGAGRGGTEGGGGLVHMPYGGIWEAAKEWEWECIKIFAPTA